MEQLSTWAIVKDEADEIVSLETVIHFDDEGMIQHRVYMFLILNQILFLILGDETFQHHFHCIELSISKAFYKVYLTETSNR